MELQKFENLEKQEKVNRSLMACDNLLCRLNYSRYCFVDEHIELLCKPYVYRNECQQRIAGGKVVTAMESMAGGRILPNYHSRSMKKKPILGDICPDCDGEGEVFVGISIPDSEGYDTCQTCNGKKRLPTVEELRKMHMDAIDLHADVSRLKDELQQYKGRLRRFERALEYYADPDTYFAIGFFPDHPCGEFMGDFSECAPLGKKPGKRARIALGIEKRKARKKT
jgi:hypothetical protein